MKFAQLVILVLAFLIIKPASAGLLIEPVLGYNMGKAKTDISGASTEHFNGPSYGGRLGYQNFGFQLGIDYLKSNLTMSDKDYDNLETSEWAGFVGFEFPILLRVYAGYIFSATGETKVENAGVKEKIDFKDGKGMKLGVGFTLLPFLDINVEYRKAAFGEFKQDGVKFDEDTDYDAYMVGISLPFVL